MLVADEIVRGSMAVGGFPRSVFLAVRIPAVFVKPKPVVVAVCVRFAEGTSGLKCG